MTWVCAGMAWECAGMTWVCAGMAWECAGMTARGIYSLWVIGTGELGAILPIDRTEPAAHLR